ncbi:MAG TPA: serine hydrolase domain-containing protein, partial [Gemmatimonadaceae bacterium]|nr:serine hydrolase domain-containing protein [Gemmatimonadaceae bacterium]
MLRLIVPMSLLGSSVAAQQPSAGGEPPRPSPISQTELFRRLTKSIDSLAAAGQFSGVAVLAKNGVTIFQRATGMADRERGIAINGETAFNLGSINKTFTQIAILQLRAAGKLDLDSTLVTYWPDYPNKEVARRITIRQLLRHSSGIGGNIFDPPAGGKRNDIRTLGDFLPLFVNEPLQFEPGSRNAYSNPGYVVLGLLIERLSGSDYYTYVREHIFRPAGMTRTGSFFVDSLPSNTAIGYTRGDENAPANTPLRPNFKDLPGRGSSAGGGYSTAHDLVKFVQALREQRIPNGLPPGIGDAGGSGGVNAIVEGELPGGYDLVVLTNLDPPAAERVARMTREWLGARDD